MPLSQAYRDYNQTHVNVNDVPGLTDYLIKQDQPERAWDEEMRQLKADRYVRRLHPHIEPGVERRLFDVLMRNTGGDASPIEPMLNQILDMLLHPVKTYQSLDYILGNNTLPFDYNLPSRNTEMAYNGFWTPNNYGSPSGEPIGTGSDMISAYLGTGDIRSDLATKYSGAEKDTRILNNTPFANYISSTYPDKDIQLYELNLNTDYNIVPTDSTRFVEWQPWTLAPEDDDVELINGWGTDWGGHFMRLGTIPGNQKTVKQQADIWKFNPEEYDKKWGLFDIEKWGIRRLDALGNPVVTYTPPYYVDYGIEH